ncbi:store-operated calcium entry-associated regulatory factor-like [Bradysia coprophila]|uniref:store-operated calcium entry-associated regulatory factor-like n=1 Tax=Bradysia coprophila TaxID=38358 RepID=UPI00187DB673|nr:store-operated calcium entry-associated regulatory factor-like [Bradysia coprophila]
MNSKDTIFVLLLAIVSVSAKRDSIRLKDVNTLTLYSDKWTTSRRSAPVKQLTCVGGQCNRAQIETAQCYNRGFDGNDVQWECKAELPSNYKFGRLEVSCEGYDYPEDDYILVGSCGLEYTIAEVSKTSSSYFPSSPQSSHSTNGDRGSTFLTILFIGGAIALYFYLRPSQTSEQRDNTSGGSSFNPSAPPPPGFRPDFCGTSDTSFGTSSTGTSNNPGNSNGPGFFSGMATGGILGYLFGSNRNNGYGRRDHRQSSFWNNPAASGYSSFGSLRRGSSGGSATKSTSTGFASTKRR